MVIECITPIIKQYNSNKEILVCTNGGRATPRFEKLISRFKSFFLNILFFYYSMFNKPHNRFINGIQ